MEAKTVRPRAPALSLSLEDDPRAQASGCFCWAQSSNGRTSSPTRTERTTWGELPLSMSTRAEMAQTPVAWQGCSGYTATLRTMPTMSMRCGGGWAWVSLCVREQPAADDG